jgi:serine/threonine-protein kinase
LNVGDLLADRYELEELVGSGGMSSVYRAHDGVLDRPVALKVLHERLTGDREYLERFRREAQMVAGLVHQNIVTVIDRGEDGGRPFIVFEYVGGENLKQLVARDGPLPVVRVLELGVQIARGLAYAHENGYVHRDVKPQNVLLNGDGEAKVTDFGIARSLDVEHGVTQTGAVLGTSDYIAPEQAQGRRAGERTDVYSLGVVLYELLTGAPPFSGENFVAVAMQHINEPVPPVAEQRPDVPPRLDAAVRRALAKEPERRFATMEEFGRELEACRLEPAEPGGAQTMVIRRPRRAATAHRGRSRLLPLALVLVAAGLAAGVAALVLLLRDDGSSPPAASSGTPVALTGSGSYDPDGNDHVEHPDRVQLATDGNAATYWETDHYSNQQFGNLKPGVGLVLDAGASVRLRRVAVSTDTPGFTARIEVGTSPGGPFTPVSGVRTVGARTTFDLDATGRYVVVWITRLPPGDVAHVNEVDAS